MEREPAIIGKNINPEQAKEIGGIVRDFAERGKEPVEGEIGKTSKEIGTISNLGSYLGAEIEALDLEIKPEIEPERIHFLESGAFERRFPERIGDAVCDNTLQAVFIDKVSRPDNFGLYKTVLHEMVHLASFRKFDYDPEKGEMDPYRSGYHVHHEADREESEHGHFRGFNEAVVDKLTFEILMKHSSGIAKELDIKPGELSAVTLYGPYLAVVDKVIAGVAEKNGETPAAVWRRFKIGAVTGDMMHLRDVEKTFGKGSLRVIAAMGSAERPDLSPNEVCGNILKYLDAKTEKEKNELAAFILNKAERYRYLKRKGIIKTKKPGEKMAA